LRPNGPETALTARSMRAFIVALALLAVLLIDGAPVRAGEALAATRPLGKADRVVVEKAAKRMHLMQGEAILKTYTIALGRYAEGHKEEQGDSRTPEGRYWLDGRNARSNFYKAIRVTYPNEDDIARARERGVKPGGNIMIHGLANGWSARALGHPALNWTRGCIAVTNREMDEIWAAVDDGTPIDILP